MTRRRRPAPLFPRLVPVFLALALAAPALAGEATKGPAPFEALAFRSIGPAAGGRAARVAGVPGDPRVYYVATASGGVWKSHDGGIRWEPIFDDQPVSSIGAIAVAPSDPNVVYVGSGEANIRGNVAAGNGIYKSTDAGKTWSHVLKQEGQIGTVIVHPKDPDVAFAAVLGHAFGPNPERGVYRTRDGGKTWKRVLERDPDTGASDVCFDPTNPTVLFAGLWQARRRPWELTSGGPGSGLFRSGDGGDTWTELGEKEGLPKKPWGKVGVAVAPSDGRRVYALIEADEGGLYVSTDGGKSFELKNPHHALRQRAWYYTTLTIDPTNPDVVWFPQVPMLKTIDGGKTILNVKGLSHGDHHDLWIDPIDPKRMIGANDGGVDVTIDAGESWYAAPLPIGQFYHVAVDDSRPYRVLGAMQDLGTASGPSDSLSSEGIRLADWRYVGGGEAGHVVAVPGRPDIVFAGEYMGYISRYDQKTRQARHVGIYPEDSSGHGAEDLKYRFQWTAPILASRHQPGVVYHGANVLFRSADGGQSWTAISPDLTRNDKSKQKWSGGPITGDNTGVEVYDTIFALAESPLEPGLLWVGSDDGLVHLTRDGGATWTDVTENVPGLPEWGTVSLIEPSPFDAATAYLVVDAHRLDDMRPYLWVTTDYGRSWKSLAKDLPQDVYLHAVREDPKRRGLLYLGTERGVSYSSDAGSTWRPLHLKLPTVAVHDLVVAGDDLVLATHGRSIWILDDLTAIREMSPEIQEKAVHLFSTRDATRFRRHPDYEVEGTYPNPPRGAIIQYYLKEAAGEEIRLEIRDRQGQLVRTLSSTPKPAELPPGDPDGWGAEPPKPELSKEKGVQRAVWDLTYEGATKIKGAKLDWGDPKRGPMVVPGEYTLTLQAGGETLTGTVRVLPDPRVELDAADLQEQVEQSLEIRDAISRLSGAVDQVRSIRSQLQERIGLWERHAAAQSLLDPAREIIARCDALEAKLQNPRAEVSYDILAQKGGVQLYSRMSALYVFTLEGDGRPTQGQRETFAAQSRELAGLLADLERLETGDLAELNRAAAALPAVLLPEPRATP
jgi:photosystem II stability/assembly factor-like uncharacterized protein